MVITYICVIFVVIPLVLSGVFVSNELPLAWPWNLVCFMSIWVVLGSCSCAVLWWATLEEQRLDAESMEGKWCDCSCDVYLCSLPSAHANLTINMQFYTLQGWTMTMRTMMTMA
jgi:hypothetical protein